MVKPLELSVTVKVKSSEVYLPCPGIVDVDVNNLEGFKISRRTSEVESLS